MNIDFICKLVKDYNQRIEDATPKTRVCKKCNKRRAIDEFPIRRYYGTHQIVCSKCRSTKNKDSYEG